MIFGGIAERLTQFVCLAANAEKVAWRGSAIKILRDLEQSARAHPVGTEARNRIRNNALESKGGRGAEVGIDEKDQILMRKIENMLNLKLKIGQ